jgi:multicomponent Na+:H+ antiporter subunit E
MSGSAQDDGRRPATPSFGSFNLFILNVILGLAWGFVTGSFTLVNLAFGFALAFVALWLPRRLWGEVKYFRRTYLVLRLIAIFVRELVKSGVTVARIVLRPGLEFRSGILAIPLACKSDLEIMIFANLITLTPGTLSIDVSDDRSTLYVHAIHTDDPAADKQGMKDAFEVNIREALE